MARLARVEVFAADEIAVVHVMARTVRRCCLLGEDAVTGKNYDHRKLWLDDQLVHQARHFGIVLLCQAILSNHIHLVLRSRPDVVAEWGDSEVARRWLTPMSSAWHLYYPLRPCKVPFQSQAGGDHGDDFLLRDTAIRARFACGESPTRQSWNYRRSFLPERTSRPAATCDRARCHFTVRRTEITATILCCATLQSALASPGGESPARQAGPTLLRLATHVKCMAPVLPPVLPPRTCIAPCLSLRTCRAVQSSRLK